MTEPRGSSSSFAADGKGQAGGYRQKVDAATQAVKGGPSEGPSLPRIPTKRVRFRTPESEAGDVARDAKRVAIEFTSPSGRRLVHIDPKSYVPRATDLVTEPWVDEQTTRYILNFISYHNNDGPWFPIHVLPASSWAVVDEDPSVMHRTYNNRPLLMWIVGSFVGFQLGSDKPDSPTRLEVTVDFLREVDRSCALQAYNDASTTALAELKTLTARSPESESEGYVTYTDVYDARRGFQDRSKLKEISPARIRGGDVVLLECTLVRFERGGGDRTASFLLHSLYWLAGQPPPTVVHTFPPRSFPHMITFE